MLNKVFLNKNMKDAISKLKPNKKIKQSFDIIVKKIEKDDYLDLIEIDAECDNILFKNLTISKGEIFPVPNLNDKLSIKRLFIDYDKDITSLRVFLEAEMKEKSKVNNINQIKYQGESYSFSKAKIVESLKTLCNIEESLDTSVFRIDSIKDNFYILFSFKDLKSYIFEKDVKISYNKSDLILIANFIISNNTEIKLSKISITKKLNEEQLFGLNRFYDNKIKIFKVIDIDEQYYTLINSERMLYVVKRNQEIDKKEIKLCQILLINYIIDKIDNNKEDIPKEIELSADSIIYMSKQDVYFSKLLHINKLSVINIDILDYNNKKNYYEEIIIENKNFLINKNKLFCVIFKANVDDDYIPLEIKLCNSKEVKVFYFFLYIGLLNKINAFINYTENSYFIEYFFMSVDIPLKNLDINLFIRINEEKYELKDNDTFLSKNRKRINVLNVPYQEIENFDRNQLNNENSIQICKIFYKKKSIIFGIFNINIDIKKSTDNDNINYDDFYEYFADIPDLFIKQDYKDEELKVLCSDRIKRAKITINEYNKNCASITSLTQSQFKARFGILICYYMNKIEINEIIDFKSWCYYIEGHIKSSIITYAQKLRIISFYFRKKFKNPYSLSDIIFFSKLSKNSPYSLAKELNKQEIINMTEFSRFFPAYLQFDSYVSGNYFQKEESFSFSLEPLFIMKYHLLSNYEDFIFTTKEVSDEFAYQSEFENITVINENNLFNYNYNNLKTIKKIEDIEEAKNLALPISFELRHEKNYHHKRNNKNPKQLSPFLFYRDGKAHRISVTKTGENGTEYKKGESGRIVESYFDDSGKIIIELKYLPFFGELLDYKYFIGNDFSELMKKIEEIKKKDQKLDKIIKANLMSDKIENNRIINRDELSKIWSKKLEKEGIIKIGDMHYRKEDFLKYIENSKNKNKNKIK